MFCAIYSCTVHFMHTNVHNNNTADILLQSSSKNKYLLGSDDSNQAIVIKGSFTPTAAQWC